MKWLSLILLLLAILLSPSAAGAAALAVVPAPAKAGQAFSVQVMFVPEGEQANAIEGVMKIPEGMRVDAVHTGGSDVMLWTVPPAYSHEGREIAFAGGKAGAGFPAGESSLLFTIVLEAGETGAYVFPEAVVSGFRADGAGTEFAVSIPATSIAVGTAPVAPYDARDSVAPTGIIAQVGSDASLFGGSPFVSFYGRDEGSGIRNFEIKEGWFGAYEPAERFYVLKDASAGSPVWVRAIDDAGNRRTHHVPGTGGIGYQVFLWLPLVILVLGVLVLRRRRTP